jgi:hypothetical protein
MKMEQIECSETSAYKIQAPGNHPEENIQQSLSYLNSAYQKWKSSTVDCVFSTAHHLCYMLIVVLLLGLVEEQLHFDSHTNLFRDISADKTSYFGAVCGCWSQLTTDIKTVLYYSCVVLMLSVVIKDWHHINCYLTSSEIVALLDISSHCKLYKILGKQSVYIWGNEECCY